MQINEKPLVRVRLKGLAGTYNNLDSLKKITGYNLKQDGNDYVAFDGDPKLTEPCPNFLKIGELINLEKPDAAFKIVKELDEAAQVPSQIKIPDQVGVIGDLGFYSRLDHISKLTFFAKKDDLNNAFKNEIFPFAKELGANDARVVAVDIKKFYARVALPKLSFLIGRFGIDRAEEVLFDRRAFAGVLPGVFEPQELLHSLVMFPPYIFGYALHRPTSAVFLLPERLKVFDYRCFKTLPDYFSIEISHLQAEGERASFRDPILKRDIQDFFTIVVDGTNKFWDYFTRPLNWLNSEGVFDELNAIKAMALGRLLVADMAGIQRSSTSFVRNRLMFEFFDKFAQLFVERANVRKQERKNLESKWASHFMHDKMLELVISILGYHARQTHKNVFKKFEKFAFEIRASVRRDLKATHVEAKVPLTDASEAECIRIIRNLAHGTFLSGGRFEEQFLKVSPEVPVDAHRLPWLYLLVFSLDPDYFAGQVIKFLKKLP